MRVKDFRWVQGFFGFLGFLGLGPLIRGDWSQALWLLWFLWFVYFFPKKKNEK